MEEVRVESEFWDGRRVLITGHTGFKGGWLSLWLSSLGAEVDGIALAPSTKPSLFEVARVDSSMRHSHIGDVRDLDLVSEVLADSRPSVLFHLAAQPLVRRSYDDPLETFSINVMGTVGVLEACRTMGSLDAAVVITSDKCYSNSERPWGYREDESLGGRDPYSASKACTEHVAYSYRESFLDREGTRLATARAGNVIGGGDWSPDRLVTDAVRGFQSRECVGLRYPDAVRPWQHVLDPLRGYLLLAQALVRGRTSLPSAWNFGPRPGDEWTVREVIEYMAERWPQGGRWEVNGRADLHEATTLRLDSTLARIQLGWRPLVSTPRAIDMTIDWFVDVDRGNDAKACCLEQIHEHTRLERGADPDEMTSRTPQ